MIVRMQQRRGNTTDWSAANPVLAEGEIGFNVTNKRIKIGDGSTAWNDLAYNGDGTFLPVANPTATGSTTVGNLLLGGSQRSSVGVRTVNYTITHGLGSVVGNGEIQLCDATAGDFTISLGNAPAAGYVYLFKKIDATGNKITITSTGTTPYIENSGFPSAYMNRPNAVLRIVAVNTTGGWRILQDEPKPPPVTFGMLAHGLDSVSPYPTARAQVTMGGYDFTGYDGAGPVFGTTPASMESVVQAQGPWSWANDANHSYGLAVAEAGNGQPKSLDFETLHTGQDIFFWFYSLDTTQVCRIFIDDRPIEAGELTIGNGAGTAQPIVRVHFTEYGTRRVRVTGPFFLIAVMTNQFQQVRLIQRDQAIAISDSYLETLGPNTTDAICTILRTKTGLRIRNFAQGGTGFINPGALTGSTPYGSADRLARYATVKDPKFILINGTINDNSYTDAAAATACRQLYTDLGRIHPGVPIIHVGVQSLDKSRGAISAARNAVLKAEAAIAPNVVKYIDPYSDPWLTGTGDSSAPVNDGNQQYMIAADQYHLTQMGGRHYAGNIWDTGLRDAPIRIYKETA